MAGGPLAQGWCDSEDRLVRADPPLADLQISCGGSIPGVIAIPALREVVAKARRFGLKLARPIAAQDGEQAVRLWVEVTPARAVQAGDDDHPADCLIAVLSWHTQPLPFESGEAAGQRRIEIDRALAEGVGRLDARQGLLDFASDAPDLAALTQAMRGGLGRPWTDFVTLPGNSHRQPIHWRLLDGADVACPGSARAWRATLVPQPAGGGDPVGFELLFTSDAPLAVATQTASEERMIVPAIVGREVAPVLRLPLARIIANAETIRARLEGPLDEEYSQYAADIAGAAQHLLGLVDDLADLEVIEAADFTTAPDHIDLADVARRAGGILGVKARARRIVLDLPPPGAELAAVGEFRRVLQVLLNLIGNAIRYSPEQSRIAVVLEHVGGPAGGRARITIADQGPGLALAEQARVFEKFERLGRSGDDGSGLGLYISRRLARAMGGDLSVVSTPGAGARFTLELPDGAASGG